jgi:hypothetical protein
MVIKKIEEFISSKICSVPEAVCMNQPHVIRHESLIAQIQLRLEKLENDVEVQLATHNKFSNEINGSLSQVKEQVTLLNFKMDEFSRRYDKDRI